MSPTASWQCQARPGDWHGAALRLFAAMFAGPLDEAAVKSYRSGQGAEILRALAAEPALRAGIEQMQIALRELPQGNAGTAELARAHVVLFSGAGGPASVSPYESAFTEPTGRLFGASEAAMQALLAAHDLSVAAPGNEPADHIATELALLAELYDRSPSADRSALRDRLIGWLPAFRNACRRCDRSGFYAGAATAAAGLLQALSGPQPAIGGIA